MDIGKKIKQARKEANLSRQRLGEIVGCSFSTVGNWENNNREPSIDFLLLISKATGKSVSWFFETDNNDGIEIETSKQKFIVKPSGLDTFLGIIRDQMNEQYNTQSQSVLEEENNSPVKDIDFQDPKILNRILSLMLELRSSFTYLPARFTASLTQELAPVRQFIEKLESQTSHEDLLNKIEELVKKVKLNNLVAEPKKPDNVVQFPFPQKTKKLKVSRAAVGAGKKWAEYANDVAGEIQVPCQGKPEYAIIARGFSMEPDIHDGSLLLVRATNLLYKDGDIVIAYLPQDNEWTVKQIFISPDRKQVKLRGTRGYEEKLPASDVIVQGVVEDIIKDPEEVEEILNDNNIDIKAL